MKKPKFFTKKEVKEDHKPMNKWKKVTIWVGTFVVLAILFWAVYGVYSFFSTYSLRTPILIQSPIVWKGF